MIRTSLSRVSMMLAGFDVAVNHAAAVRVVQCARCLVYQFDHIVDAQQIVGTAVGSQGARPVHVLGHDVAVTILFAGVVNRQNVRMLKHADHVRFGQKHLAGDALAIFIAAGFDVVDLDGHIAAVVRIVRKIDDAGCCRAPLR